jgi:hypothetical protein
VEVSGSCASTLPKLIVRAGRREKRGQRVGGMLGDVGWMLDGCWVDVGWMLGGCWVDVESHT